MNSTIHKAALGLLLGAAIGSSQAHIAVNPAGAATTGRELVFPPGAGGLQPRLSISYSSFGASDVLGAGWTLDGVSRITRCPSAVVPDSATRGVSFSTTDKLCLDGRRLVRVDASEVEQVGAGSVDAAGKGSTSFIEYRPLVDPYIRVRAYGFADGSNASSGPAWFRVWTKNGEILDYGKSPSADANTKALITSTANQVGVTWALARMTDRFGNFVDFKYGQYAVSLGTSGSYQAGRDWRLQEIQYSGNKVILAYEGRNGFSSRDVMESYLQGYKRVNNSRLKSITAYVNSPNTSSLGKGTSAVAVRTYNFVYNIGARSGRARLESVKECAGDVGSAKCLPATKYSYTEGSDESFKRLTNTGIDTVPLSGIHGTQAVGQRIYGMIIADFNGDGRDDIIAGSGTPTMQRLYFSNGDGTFTESAAFTAQAQSGAILSLAYSGDANDSWYSAAVDFNRDGLPDLLTYSLNGKSSLTALYLNNGNGSFTKKTISGLTLNGFQQASLVNKDANGLAGNTQGQAFFLVDVNDDAIPDVVTTTLPALAYPTWDTKNPYPEATACGAIKCTRVFKGDGAGGFTEITTNLIHKTLYSWKGEQRGPGAGIDVDGDGLGDLLVPGTPEISQAPVRANLLARSRGDGNFDIINVPIETKPDVKDTSLVPIDYNGTGRPSFVFASEDGPDANKLLVADSPGGQLSVVSNSNLATDSIYLTGPGMGFTVVDLNNDGRDDLYRWYLSVVSSKVYLSNGDGSFTESTSFNLPSLGSACPTLTKANAFGPMSAVFLGDFLGNGQISFLVADTNNNNSDYSSSNCLLVKQSDELPDVLYKVTEGTGLTSQVTYFSPASNPVLPLGRRYASDRGTANAAQAPVIDLVPRGRMVASLIEDVGVGSSQVVRQYSYGGLKYDTASRQYLGLRTRKTQHPTIDDKQLLVVDEFFQTWPYVGAPAKSSQYVAALDTAVLPGYLSETTNAYCDVNAPAGADQTALKGGAPCGATSILRRPYALSTKTRSFDLDGSALPTSTVTWGAPTLDGERTTVTESVVGKGGVNDTFGKTATNSYFPIDKTCSDIYTCKWLVNQRQQATTQSSAPNYLPAVSAGSSPTATLISGVPSTTLGNVNFGTLAAGGSKTLNSTLANTGVIAVAPDSASVTGAAFDLQSTTCPPSLAGGASCQYAVRFVAAGLGPRGGTLNVPVDARSLVATLSAVSDQSTVNYGHVAVGASSTKAETLSNLTGQAMTLTVPSSTSIAGTDFSFVSTTCGGSLAAGASCSISVKLTPSAKGSRSGTMTLSTSVGTLTSSLMGTGDRAELAFSPSTLAAFADTQVGQTRDSTTVTLTNGGNVSASSLSLSAPSGFSIVSSTCGTTLAASASCTFKVRFAPTAGQVYSGNVTVAATSPALGDALAVSGEGVVQSASLTSALAFGAIDYGQSTSKSATLTNNGAGPLTLTVPGSSSVTGTDFSFVSTTCASPLAPSASCTIVVKFQPTDAGARSGALKVTTGAGVKTSTLSGTGNMAKLSFDKSSVELVATVGSTSSTGVKLTNSGNVTLNGLVVGVPTGFNVPFNQCGSSIAAGATCDIAIQFLPTAEKTYSGTLSASGYAPSTPATAPLTGTGVVDPVVSSATFNPTSVVSGATSTFAWTTSKAVSASVTCASPASGSGSGLSGSITVNATASGTGTCTVTALNAAGKSASKSANLAITPPPGKGAFAFVASDHTAPGQVMDLATIQIQNTGTGTITGIVATCGNNWANSGTPGPTTLAPGAFGNYQCRPSIPSAVGTLTLTGANASNSGFVTNF